MLFGNSDGNWNNKLMSRVIKNREAYCKLHNYHLINANEMIDRSRPVAWSKLLAAEKYISTNKYDYIFYIDMDAIIINLKIKLETIISFYPKRDFIMASDWNGLNTGVWLVKNSEFSKWFLLTAWKQDHLIESFSPNNIPYPFKYEQRSFHFLLDTDEWKRRNLPKYRGNTSELNNHFKLLPQCTFNSYSMHPFDNRGDRKNVQYIPGDFLIHFAGKKRKFKADLMQYYLSIAEKLYK
jgi:hypothetical protein